MLTKYIGKAQLVLGVVCLSVFIVAILIQVFARYLAIPVIWTEEVANFSFIWSVFMGASIMVNRKEHFRFTGLTEKLKGRSKLYLDILVNVIVLVFNVLLIYYGALAVQTFWNYTWISLPKLKMGYVWSCIPIMGLTMSIYLVEHIIDDLGKLRRREYE